MMSGEFLRSLIPTRRKQIFVCEIDSFSPTSPLGGAGSARAGSMLGARTVPWEMAHEKLRFLKNREVVPSRCAQCGPTLSENK